MVDRDGRRFWEIDFLRGCSILLMIGFHMVYDLNDSKLCAVDLSRPFYLYWQRLTAVLFLLLVGLSLTLTGRKKESPESLWRRFGSFARRGGKIFGWGMLVTAVTRLFLGRGFVVFGVLHLIGLAVILAYPFLKLRFGNLLLGGVAVGLGLYFNQCDYNLPWLLWAGLQPPGFFSVDYFPVFPWFGVVLWGIFLGNRLYRDGGRSYPCGAALPERPPGRLMDWMCRLGRKSLWIYLIHQPVLLLGMILCKVWLAS